MTEYVIRGNAAVLKCSIPSFVADFVRVESWIDEAGTVLTATDNYGRKYEFFAFHKEKPFHLVIAKSINISYIFLLSFYV